MQKNKDPKNTRCIKITKKEDFKYEVLKKKH